ncbi:hypothetical protein DMX03_17930 [Pseudomonas koreensis]|nr:hypothetical protein DMX03_17930 [Pseudomonas koreensis]
MYYSTEFSSLTSLQLVFDVAHFVLDQVDRQCLNIRYLARFMSTIFISAFRRLLRAFKVSVQFALLSIGVIMIFVLM